MFQFGFCQRIIILFWHSSIIRLFLFTYRKLLKDQVLSWYISPYLAKISRRPEKIILIDAFAGAGKFGNNEAGSPLIICKAAEKYAKGKYKAFFVNRKQRDHFQLQSIIKAANWDSSAIPVLGDSKDFLKSIVPALDRNSVFLYLDPFGLKDCQFSVLTPFLERDTRYSTEILINLSMPIMHRLAGREAWLANPQSNLLEERHKTLTSILGGDYWKSFLLAEADMSPKEREIAVIEGYTKLLAKTLPYTGYCPVRETPTSQTKYFIIFASRHKDTMVLMNDSMVNAFNKYMNEVENDGTLFAQLHWRNWRDSRELENIIKQYVSKYPNNTRKDLWREIVCDHFMKFAESEYKEAVNALVTRNDIYCSTPIGSEIRKTKQLNDRCILVPKS